MSFGICSREKIFLSKCPGHKIDLIYYVPDLTLGNNVELYVTSGIIIFQRFSQGK